MHTNAYQIDALVLHVAGGIALAHTSIRVGAETVHERVQPVVLRVLVDQKRLGQRRLQHNGQNCVRVGVV